MKILPVYSNYTNRWFVAKEVSETSCEMLWPCNNKQDAESLSEAMNNGAAICKGSRLLRTNCGNCPKCQYTLETLN